MFLFCIPEQETEPDAGRRPWRRLEHPATCCVSAVSTHRIPPLRSRSVVTPIFPTIDPLHPPR